jgi:ankyrin repeat protein
MIYWLMTLRGENMMKTAFRIVMLLFVLSHVASSQEIFDAVRNGDLIKVKELVEKDPQLIEARTARQSTPLLVAVSVDNKPIARYLIEKGAELNVANLNQWTPLFYAQNVEFVRLLLENGADVDFGTPDYTPLIHSVWNGNREVADYLLARGASIPGTGTQFGVITAIHAIKTGCVPYVEQCMRQGFDPLYESEAGSNLLHYASAGNSIELVEQLIGMGVPLSRRNIFGFTPLHKAASQGNTEMVELFIQKGSDTNARTRDGSTPYNLAVEGKRDGTVDYLKSIGADQSPQKFPVLKGKYMGQQRPGKKAIPFAPGIVSGQHSYHASIVFTPEGNEMFWSVAIEDEGSESIFTAKQVNGKWTSPEVFSKGDVPFVSPDGKKLYFVADKQIQETYKEVIMAKDRTVTGWSEPCELPETVNSMPRIHWQVSVDSKGTLYFGASNNIYYSEYQYGNYSEPEPIECLNDMNAFSPYIAPDGSYLIVSIEREGERLVLLFKKSDGSWTEPIEIAGHIGVEIGYCPVVTPDSRYLFFVGGLGGMYAPYWVDVGFIEELRPKE